jgi:hypothetical protein
MIRFRGGYGIGIKADSVGANAPLSGMGLGASIETASIQLTKYKPDTPLNCLDTDQPDRPTLRLGVSLPMASAQA